MSKDNPSKTTVLPYVIENKCEVTSLDIVDANAKKDKQLLNIADISGHTMPDILRLL